jgi:hypothetical protein
MVSTNSSYFQAQEVAGERSHSRAGIGLNGDIATVLAAHVAAQAEAERVFAGRARPGTARAVLAQAGKRRRPRLHLG